MNGELESLIELAKEGIDHIAEEFDDPEDDFNPVVFFSKDGESFGMVGIHPSLVNDDAAKDVLAYALLPRIIMSQRATSFLFVSSTWTIKADDEEAIAEYHEWRKENPQASLEDFPSHGEMLVLIGSDGEEDIFYHADIERDHVNPPLIGEWKEEEANMMGRMVGPMRAALAEVRGEKRDGETEN